LVNLKELSYDEELEELGYEEPDYYYDNSD